MSYILEALRKADAERELGDAPELQGLAGAAAGGASGASGTSNVPVNASGGRWRWLVAGAAIPIAALVAWKMLAPEPDATPAVALATQAPVPVPAPPAPAPSPAIEAPASAATAAAAPASAAPAEAAPSAADAEPQAEAAAPPPSAPVAPARKKLPPKPPPRQRAEADRAPAAGPAAAPAPVPTLAQLPEDLRRQVPAMSIGGSVYSALPADRMLVVNGQVVREGTALAPELRLETIGRQTAVFSIRGQRFQVKL